jgi:hypothetical protein
MFNELVILITFFPLVFVPFDALASLRKFLGWSAVILALLCNAYQIRNYFNNPSELIPLIGFLVSFSYTMIERKKFRGLTVLGALFIVQAMTAKSLPIIVILLIFSDTFFCAEYFTFDNRDERNRAMQSLFRSLISFLPIAVAILLKSREDILAICVALTIILRAFSWPLSNWVKNLDQEKNLFVLCVGAASTFILWRTQTVSQEPAWAFAWICISLVMSLGCEAAEIVPVLGLSLFGVSPAAALLVVGFWPLIARASSQDWLIVLFSAVVGYFIIPVSLKLFVEEAGIPITLLCSLLLARNLVVKESPRRAWLPDLISAGLSLVAMITIVLLFPTLIESAGSSVTSMVFAASLLIFYIVGRLIVKKKPRIFKKANPLNLNIDFASAMRIKVSDERPEVRVGVPPLIFDTFLSSLEAENYLLLLVGALGAFLLWTR